MAMSKSIGRLAIALLAVLAASSAFAQNAGSLRGIVTDQQGAILPGVVSPDQNDMQSVSNGGGANNTGGYSVNGVRGSNNVIQLDGSRLIDIGSNSGLIIAPNTDFVSEGKIQSSNYAAEFGSGGVQVSMITKGGSSEFHGTAYDYMRHYKFAANDRSNAIAGVEKPKSKYQYPGGNLSGPILDRKSTRLNSSHT